MKHRLAQIVTGLIIAAGVVGSSSVAMAQRTWGGTGGGWTGSNIRNNGDAAMWGAIGSGIGGLLNSIPQNNNNANNRNRNNNNNDYYYDDQPRYRQQYNNYPTYSAAPRQAAPRPVATAKANPLPPPPKATVAANNKPTFALTPMPGSIRSLNQQLVAAQEQTKVNDVQARLDAAGFSGDPGVQSAMQNIKDKAALGLPITTDDTNRLRGAIANANNGVAPPPSFTAGFDSDLGAVEQLSQIRPLLIDPPGGSLAGGGVLGGSTGTMPIIYNPSMPDGETYVLNSGAVMVGTGGSGTMFVAMGTPAQAMGLPIGTGDPVPGITADANKPVTGGTVIFAPKDLGMTVSYLINDTPFSINPGETQNLPVGTTWVIRFNRGGSFGEASYTLSEGTYAFGSGEQGWELFTKTFSVTIDNTANSTPFTFVTDNRSVSIAAGQIQAFTSKYPMFVQFDRGGGNHSIEKKVEDKATYTIAVNPGDSLWDLYAADQVKASGPPTKAEYAVNWGVKK